MKVLVNGVERELNMVDENGVNNVVDFIGNWGAIGQDQGQFAWDEEAGVYVTDEDTFQWWEKAVEREVSNDDRIAELKERLGTDVVADGIALAADGNNDLEDIQNAISAALDELEGK